jgi:hypothetical protein
MTKTRKGGSVWASAMRWAARLLALVTAGLFVVFVADNGPTALGSLSWASPRGVPLLLALLVALAGLLFAWRWELLGTTVAASGAASIVLLVCAGSGFELLRCALLFTSPLLLASALYLGSSWRRRVRVTSGTQ